VADAVPFFRLQNSGGKPGPLSNNQAGTIAFFASGIAFHFLLETKVRLWLAARVGRYLPFLGLSLAKHLGEAIMTGLPNGLRSKCALGGNMRGSANVVSKFAK
jgi:hypothetical protein